MFKSLAICKILSERVGLIVLGFSLFTAATPALALPDDCSCPQVDCGPCARSEGLSFYTEKCGGGSRVKSCSKVACVPLNPLPSHCTPNTAATNNNSSTMRQPASTTGDENRSPGAVVRAPEVGVVKVVKGTAWVIEPNGQKSKLNEGSRVQEGVKVVTESGSGSKISFDNSNEVILGPESELDLTKVDHPKSDSRKTILNLIKGKVRNKVRAKYQGTQSSSYEVRTRSAVAGVRGTDFVVSYEQKERLITKVETITGEVELADKSLEQKVTIEGGKYASYVVAANSSGVFNEDEINEFVTRGYLTPVYEMSASEIKALEYATELEERSVAKVKAPISPGDRSICSSPQGQLNQCSWTCENNPKGADRCRTDLPQVNCVRRRCNANGEWAEDSRLPASHYDACQAHGVRVDTCDY